MGALSSHPSIAGLASSGMAVVTSAVILHNAPPVAEAIRREVVRVARRFAAHNEDLDVTYNRYGYDTAAWYLEPYAPI